MIKFLKRVIKIFIGIVFLFLVIVLLTGEEEKLSEEVKQMRKEFENKYGNLGKITWKNDIVFLEKGRFEPMGTLGDRAYVVYTTAKNRDDMIEYARSKPWKEKRQTLVHFYNNLEVASNDTNTYSYAEEMLLEKASGKAKLIGRYQKV